MSNYIYANYQVCEGMVGLSPRRWDVVDFSVIVTFADGRYTVCARRSDSSNFYECKVAHYSYKEIMRAVCSALRSCCGYGSSYWSLSLYCEVTRGVKRGLHPFLPYED